MLSDGSVTNPKIALVVNQTQLAFVQQYVTFNSGFVLKKIINWLRMTIISVTVSYTNASDSNYKNLRMVYVKYVTRFLILTWHVSLASIIYV